jgi:hypothetical protein
MFQKQFITHFLSKRVVVAANINYLEKEQKKVEKFILGSSLATGGFCASFAGIVYQKSDFVPFTASLILASYISTVVFNDIDMKYTRDINILKNFNSYLIDIQKIAEKKELDDIHILNLNDKYQSLDLIDEKVVHKNWKLPMMHDMEKLGWKDAEKLIKETVLEDI